jgi:valyl-tRNA synthetase
MNVPPGKEISVWADTANASDFTVKTLAAFDPHIKRLGKIKEWKPSKGVKPPQAATAVVADFEMHVPLEGLIDFARERARLEKERAGIADDLARLQVRLDNPDFIRRAPPEEVEKARALRAEKSSQKTRLEGHLAALK